MRHLTAMRRNLEWHAAHEVREVPRFDNPAWIGQSSK